jgi:ribonuclease-3
MNKNKLLEQQLFYEFKDAELIEEALTHSSYCNENKRYKGKDNERLEFFGDAILGMVIAEYLFLNLKHTPEGVLTRYRAKIVCEETLSKISLELKLGDYMRFGKGELITGGAERPSILADAFESIIGAIYLDSNFDTTRAFILRMLADKIELALAGQLILDHKTALQEKIQKSGAAEIVYKVMEEFGPDHSKTFIIAVEVSGKTVGQGKGHSKKEAEQNAAQNALEKGLG